MNPYPIMYQIMKVLQILFSCGLKSIDNPIFSPDSQIASRSAYPSALCEMVAGTPVQLFAWDMPPLSGATA